MYTYAQIEALLAGTFATLFKDSTKYAHYSGVATKFIQERSGITSDYPETFKQAFVYILQFLALHHTNNITEEFRNVITNNYKLAIQLIDSAKVSTNNNSTITKLGSMEGLYGNDLI